MSTFGMADRLVLARRPAGGLDDGVFRLERIALPDLAEGEVMVRVCWLAFDASQRYWINDAPTTYRHAVPVGDTMIADGIGEVVASRCDNFEVGQLVIGPLGWQSHAVMHSSQLRAVQPGVKPTLALGALGRSGLTAYFGLTRIGRPAPGDVVSVSGAAGSTGHMVCQIARILGCRTIAIAGGARKARWLREIAGVDYVVDHRAGDVEAGLRNAAPQGIDIHFENVGPVTLDPAIANLARGGRVVLCGGAAAYGNPEDAGQVRNLHLLTDLRARVEGFIVSDFVDEAPAARALLTNWIDQGELTPAETLAEGELRDAPQLLERMLGGAAIGKQMLQIAEPRGAGRHG